MDHQNRIIRLTLAAIAIGVLLMLVLETEKALMRRLGWFEELGGTPTRGRQA